eukprot:gene10572-22065_t
MKACQLRNGLERFLERLPEAVSLTISAEGGEELLSVRKPMTMPSTDDMFNVSSLVPCFANALDQSTRLNLGDGKYSLSWISGHILAQILIETIVVSLVLQDNANLGLLEERIALLTENLKPICQELKQSDIRR